MSNMPAWATPDVVKAVVGRDGGGTNAVHWWVGSLSDDTAYFGLRGSDNVNVACASTTTVTDGLWHHIVAVRDAIDKGYSRILIAAEPHLEELRQDPRFNELMSTSNDP